MFCDNNQLQNRRATQQSEDSSLRPGVGVELIALLRVGSVGSFIKV